MTRLWKRLTITIEFDDPSLAAELPEKAKHSLADVVLTPTAKGVMLHRGSARAAPSTTFSTSREMLSGIDDFQRLASAQARDTGGQATATGRYHMDRAAFWREVHRVVLERSHQLWPAEAA